VPETLHLFNGHSGRSRLGIATIASGRQRHLALWGDRCIYTVQANTLSLSSASEFHPFSTFTVISSIFRESPGRFL